MSNLRRFVDQVVLITGASRGIGRGVALRFAQEGAHLVLCANEDRVNDVADELRGMGCRALSVVADVREKQQVEDLLAELEQERDRIQERWSEIADDLETIHLRPRKADIFVEDWGVAWVPYWDIVLDEASGRRQLQLPAFGSVAPGMPQGRAAAPALGRA